MNKLRRWLCGLFLSSSSLPLAAIAADQAPPPKPAKSQKAATGHALHWNLLSALWPHVGAKPDGIESPLAGEAAGDPGNPPPHANSPQARRRPTVSGISAQFSTGEWPRLQPDSGLQYAVPKLGNLRLTLCSRQDDFGLRQAPELNPPQSGDARYSAGKWSFGGAVDLVQTVPDDRRHLAVVPQIVLHLDALANLPAHAEARLEYGAWHATNEKGSMIGDRVAQLSLRWSY